MTNSLLNPLLPLIRDSFALSYTDAGVAVSAYSLSVGLSNAPMGVLADRVGSRLVAVGGLVLIGAVSVAVSFAGSYGQLLALLVVMGIVSGTYHAPAASLLARAFGDRVRGAAMGLHSTGGNLSFFVAPLVAGSLAALTGTWRSPYLVFAVVPLASAAILWSVAPRVAATAPTGGRLAALRELLAVSRRVGRVVGLSVAFQVGYAAFLALVTLYLVDARGVPPPLAAALFAVPNAAGVLGSPAGGWLSDRMGRRAVIAAALATMGPGVLLFTAVPTAFIVLPLIVLGLGAAARMTVTEVLVAETAPFERRATVLGSYYLLAQEVGGVAAPALGALATAIGIAAAFAWLGLGLTALSGIVALAAAARKL